MILRAGVLTSGGWSDWLFLEKLFFAVDQGIDVISGELKTVSVGNGVRRACFNTVTAENAPGVIDVVNAGVAFASGDTAGIGILSGFNVNAICRAGRRAEKASNALFEAGFVAVQYMYSAIARLKMHRFERVILRDRFPEHIPKSHTEALHQCAERLADFPKDGCHRLGV
jgi:rhodanese-related sulfurtransferase